MLKEVLGWGEFFARQLGPEDADLVWGRVNEELRGQYEVLTEAGPATALLPGRWRLDRNRGADVPAVGDWVGLEKPAGSDKSMIRRLLDRRTKLSRNAAGEKVQEQVVAANVDVVFVMSSLNQDLNLRRLERYLAVVWESGAEPVVILTKSDLCEDAAGLAASVKDIAGAAAVLVTSRFDAASVSSVAERIPRGKTAVFIGSSGVGKSTLVNLLAGAEVQATAAIREDDDEGRHTTTSRKLFVLPSGGLVMDTPGMRELQIWEAAGGVGRTFEDIEAIALRCRFTNCGHESEPGCAIRAALESGELERSRYDSYLKLRAEAAYQTRRVDKSAASQEKERWKKIHKDLRAHVKGKRGR
jgi:ribosome biogenesis GTPase